MNSQQELLDAINAITDNGDRSYDTPATVLRVDGDTVWVHIDGGADETPVNKTINCEPGETVQVRIANGSAFLVGNASAPPTDDKTAQAAQFVAEKADEKATKAIDSVEAIVQTVEGKVDIGGSNVETLSSTMYQNANGVNIYNNTLAVGDSYAHIDGNSFDIKEATTAGTIDDANDTTLASFGQEVTVGSRSIYGSIGSHSQVFGTDCIAEGDYSHAEGHNTWADGDYSHSEGRNTRSEGDYSHAEGIDSWAKGEYSHAEGNGTKAFGDYQTVVGRWNVEDTNNDFAFIVGNGYRPTPLGPAAKQNALAIDWMGNIRTSGNIQDGAGTYNRTPRIYTSEVIASSDTSYTFYLFNTLIPGFGTIELITADSIIDVYDTIFGFTPTNITVVPNNSCTITFPAQSSSHTIKLFIY